MKRRLVPAVPFLVSLLLSLSTIGRHVYWQDSGFYLSAVREMGLLYPHGFVTYQLLCKAWTSLLFFVDFTLAVHLFSAVCAALSAGVLACAVRCFLSKDGPSRERDLAATLTGCLAASGYTFWFSADYAKVYALLYLLLSLVLWAIVRGGAAPTKRDVLRVAALAGLAWSVHPSVALGSVALGAYFLRAAKSVGWKTVAAAPALGLACALGPGLLVLPLLSARDVEVAMGHPGSAGELLQYLLGSRFVGIPGVFGLESSRVAGLGVFLWEEYLGIGLLLMIAGIVRLGRTNRPALVGGLLWTIPYMGVALLFKIEGQADHWSVAALLPALLAVGKGLEIVGTLHPRGLWIQGAAAALALTWSFAANYRDLNQRDYELAEDFGRLYLSNLEPNAVLFAHSDDVVATTWGLQTTRDTRRDVLVVNTSQLGAQELWYDQLLKRRHPELRLPVKLPEIAHRTSRESDVFVSAWLSSNADGPRPLYVTMPLTADLLPPGRILVPQGVLWKVAHAGEDRVRPEHWNFRLEPEQLPALYRRKRGLAVTQTSDGFITEAEPYERRLQKALLKARRLLADWQFKHGQVAAAARLYESILALDPVAQRDDLLLQSVALSYLALGRSEQAEAAFLATLAVGGRPWVRASSWLALGDLARGRGDGKRALECYHEASRIPGLTPEQQSAVQERLR